VTNPVFSRPSVVMTRTEPGSQRGIRDAVVELQCAAVAVRAAVEEPLAPGSVVAQDTVSALSVNIRPARAGFPFLGGLPESSGLRAW
jgi:hypothetical protein